MYKYININEYIKYIYKSKGPKNGKKLTSKVRKDFE